MGTIGILKRAMSSRQLRLRVINNEQCIAVHL